MSKLARWIAEFLDVFYDPYACGYCDLPGGVRRLRAERGSLTFLPVVQASAPWRK